MPKTANAFAGRTFARGSIKNRIRANETATLSNTKSSAEQKFDALFGKSNRTDVSQKHGRSVEPAFTSIKGRSQYENPTFMSDNAASSTEGKKLFLASVENCPPLSLSPKAKTARLPGTTDEDAHSTRKPRSPKGKHNKDLNTKIFGTTFDEPSSKFLSDAGATEAMQDSKRAKANLPDFSALWTSTAGFRPTTAGSPKEVAHEPTAMVDTVVPELHADTALVAQVKREASSRQLPLQNTQKAEKGPKPRKHKPRKDPAAQLPSKGSQVSKSRICKTILDAVDPTTGEKHVEERLAASATLDSNVICDIVKKPSTEPHIASAKPEKPTKSSKKAYKEPQEACNDQGKSHEEQVSSEQPTTSVKSLTIPSFSSLWTANTGMRCTKQNGDTMADAAWGTSGVKATKPEEKLVLQAVAKRPRDKNAGSSTLGASKAKNKSDVATTEPEHNTIEQSDNKTSTTLDAPATTLTAPSASSSQSSTVDPVIKSSTTTGRVRSVPSFADLWPSNCGGPQAGSRAAMSSLLHLSDDEGQARGAGSGDSNCDSQESQASSGFSPHKKRRRFMKSARERTARTAAYNPRKYFFDVEGDLASTAMTKANASASSSQSSTTSTGKKGAKEDLKSSPILKRVISSPNTSEGETLRKLKVPKCARQLYMVVRNVKEAHECQEVGETQEFVDDLEYLMAGLDSSQSLASRCLSAVSLAAKCADAAFRVHMRAHGLIQRVFDSLHDCVDSPPMALAAGAILALLCCDRLTIDFTSDTLKFLMRLLQTKTGSLKFVRNDPEYSKVSSKIRSILEELKREGSGVVSHLNLDALSAKELALEALLSLTSSKTGSWFKTEVRQVGGLRHIADTVIKSSWFLTEFEFNRRLTVCELESLRKVNRCLRVLENVTQTNAENTEELISYRKGALLTAVARVLHASVCLLPEHPFELDSMLDLEAAGGGAGRDAGEDDDEAENEVGVVLLNSIVAVLKFLLNVTHDCELGSARTGEQATLISSALLCLLQMPQYVPGHARFKLLVLSLGLCINLVEHCRENRRRLVECDTLSSYDSTLHGSDEVRKLNSVQALVEVFNEKYGAAREIELSELVEETQLTLPENTQQSSSSSQQSQANSQGSSVSSQQDTQQANSFDDLAKVLSNASKHMDCTITASYVALLLGCLIQDSEHVDIVRGALTDGNFQPLIDILKKFLAFMEMTHSIASTQCNGKSISHVIDILQRHSSSTSTS